MLLILAMSLFASSAWSQSMRPGVWSAKTTIELNGLPLPATEAEECITSAQAKNVRGTISKELDRSGCKIEKWDLKKENLVAVLKCEGKDLVAEGTLKGLVKTKSYDLTGDASGSFKSIPSSAKIKLSGQWARACK